MGIMVINPRRYVDMRYVNGDNVVIKCGRIYCNDCNQFKVYFDEELKCKIKCQFFKKQIIANKRCQECKLKFQRLGNLK